MPCMYHVCGVCAVYVPCMYVYPCTPPCTLYHPSARYTLSGMPKLAVLAFILGFKTGSESPKLRVARLSMEAKRPPWRPFLASNGCPQRAKRPSFGGPKGSLRTPNRVLGHPDIGQSRTKGISRTGFAGPKSDPISTYLGKLEVTSR